MWQRACAADQSSSLVCVAVCACFPSFFLPHCVIDEKETAAAAENRMRTSVGNGQRMMKKVSKWSVPRWWSAPPPSPPPRSISAWNTLMISLLPDHTPPPPPPDATTLCVRAWERWWHFIMIKPTSKKRDAEHSLSSMLRIPLTGRPKRRRRRSKVIDAKLERGRERRPHSAFLPEVITWQQHDGGEDVEEEEEEEEAIKTVWPKVLRTSIDAR